VLDPPKRCPTQLPDANETNLAHTAAKSGAGPNA
jgi:hypothetical protein